MTINKTLSSKRCWEMVNRIQNGRTPREIRERADIAIEWLRANEVITTQEFDDLMNTVSYLVRESYHM